MRWSILLLVSTLIGCPSTSSQAFVGFNSSSTVRSSDESTGLVLENNSGADLCGVRLVSESGANASDLPSRLEHADVLPLQLPAGRWRLQVQDCNDPAQTAESALVIDENNTTRLSIAGATLPE